MGRPVEMKTITPRSLAVLRACTVEPGMRWVLNDTSVPSISTNKALTFLICSTVSLKVYSCFIEDIFANPDGCWKMRKQQGLFCGSAACVYGQSCWLPLCVPYVYSPSGALSIRSMNWSSFGVMMICVRRLRCLPTSVSFEARGLYSPRPPAVSLFGSTP